MAARIVCNYVLKSITEEDKALTTPIPCAVDLKMARVLLAFHFAASPTSTICMFAESDILGVAWQIAESATHFVAVVSKSSAARQPTCDLRKQGPV